MKKKIVFSIMFLFLFSFGTLIWGQNVKFDGEIRSRIEYRDGFKNLVADTLTGATVGGLRSRINLDYADEKIKAKVTLQDFRVYGETGTNNTKSSLGIYEAWGTYLFSSQFSATLGRQALEYDDKRLLSASNWSNTGNAHDLLLLKYELVDAFKLHFGTAWNNGADNDYEKIYNVTRSYKSLAFLWFSKPFGKLDFSAIWFNDAFHYGKTDTETDKKSFRNTIGGNLGLKKKEIPLSFYATGYYQFGHDMENKSLNAYLLALNAQYKFTDVWSIAVGADYYSGTSTKDSENGKNRTFNKLYGTNHSFNGSIEYWTTLPTQGLRDLYGGITFKPNTKFNIDATFHTFSVTKKLPSTDKKALGSEIDITANYTISPQLSLQGGWSSYFKNEQTDILKKQTGIDTRFPQWAYVMLSFKPKFLNGK
jgi:hypothetical protein